MSEQPKCELCGEPMPVGEEMFKYHGHSGPCPTKGKAFEPWQLRVIEEKKELDARLVKLSEFLSASICTLRSVTPSAKAVFNRKFLSLSSFSIISGDTLMSFVYICS